MAKLLEQLGVYGWSLEDEDLVLASLLTGDPLLMVGAHGAAKTHVAYKVAQSLDKAFMAYDASKSLFEDVLGFPNVEALKQGHVEYVPSAVTVWDKEFVLIDEINRALPELQAKWLEIIRSRKIMGFPTAVKWVWAAMNPSDDSRYSGTQTMDAALIGRFAIFLYPPEALDMEEQDRVRVVHHINGDDAPSLGEWVETGSQARTVTARETSATGTQIAELLSDAATHFMGLRGQLETLGEFLSRLAILILKETEGKVKLDGRRLGFMYRTLLAVRSVEMARTDRLREPIPDLVESAKRVILASIPIGIAADGINEEEFLHKVEVCLDLLAAYFHHGSDMTRTETIYRLFTCDDLLEKTRILVSEDLSELAKAKAWNDLADSGQDVSILAYIALQIEAHRPGTIPQELLEKLGTRVNVASLSTGNLPSLKGEAVELIEQAEALLDQPNDLGRMLAYHHLKRLTEAGRVTAESIDDARDRIATDFTEFNELLAG